MRMSMIESDLKSRIEEEIREIVSRRASELIEDKLAKTAESPGLSAPPPRAVAPTLIEEEIVAAVQAAPVRSVPPVAAPTEPYASPMHSARSPYSAPPPAYSAAAPYSAPPPAYYSRPPHSFTGPPPPVMSSSYPRSLPPPSMVPSMAPSSRGEAWSGASYVVFPEVAEPSLRGAMEAAAPRRSNALLFGVALLSLALSGAAFFAKTQSPAPSANTTRVAAQPPAAPAPTFESTAMPATDTAPAAPAPTLAPAAAAAQNDAPRWSRRYKGNDPLVAPAPPAPKAADAKLVAATPAPATATPPATPAPAAAAPADKPAAAPADKPADPAATPAKMDQANKTAELLREQLDSSVH